MKMKIENEKWEIQKKWKLEIGKFKMEQFAHAYFLLQNFGADYEN